MIQYVAAMPFPWQYFFSLLELLLLLKPYCPVRSTTMLNTFFSAWMRRSVEECSWSNIYARNITSAKMPQTFIFFCCAMAFEARWPVCNRKRLTHAQTNTNSKCESLSDVKFLMNAIFAIKLFLESTDFLSEIFSPNQRNLLWVRSSFFSYVQVHSSSTHTAKWNEKFVVKNEKYFCHS